MKQPVNGEFWFAVPDMYLSDDKESRLRAEAGAPCKDCAHYWIRESWVVEGVQQGCGAVNADVPNGELVSYLMLRMAKLTGCAQMASFPGPPVVDGSVERPSNKGLALGKGSPKKPSSRMSQARK